MGSAFETDTAVTPAGEGRYEATLSDRWSILGAPNGGYLMAIAARALLHASGRPDPTTLTTHFHRSPAPGMVTLTAQPLHTGRSTSSTLVRMRQGDAPVLTMMGLAGDTATGRGPSAQQAQAPELPPPEELEDPRSLGGGPPTPEFQQRLDLRCLPGEPGWAHGTPTGRLETVAWLRLLDGPEPDPLVVVLATDALPPTVFELSMFSWVPTLEMTVHIRARPAPGWLRVAHRTRFLIDGTLEEDAEVWDSAGALVGQSRQLARTRG